MEGEKNRRKKEERASDTLQECSFCTWLGEDIIIISASCRGGYSRHDGSRRSRDLPRRPGTARSRL